MPRTVRVLPTALAVTAVAGAGAVGAAPATAAPPAVSAHAVGHVNAPGHVSRAHRIADLSTSVDRATGAWNVTVTFATRQRAKTAAALSIGLRLAGQRAAGTTWSVRTNPAALGATYLRGNPFAAGPLPPTTAAWNATGTTLTLRAVDPRLVGAKPLAVSAALSPAGADAGPYSTADAYFGPRAPRARFARGTRRLTARSDGTLRIRLSPLPRKARQTVVVLLPHHHALGARTLPARDYRRRSVTLDLGRQARHLHRTARRATLLIRTTVSSGATTTHRRTVRIRRR